MPTFNEPVDIILFTADNPAIFADTRNIDNPVDGVVAAVRGGVAVSASSEGNHAVVGECNSTTDQPDDPVNAHAGVFGFHFNGGLGVHGFSETGIGVFGESNGFDAVQGISNSIHAGVAGHNSGGGPGVFGIGTTGPAGFFAGDVTVQGTLTKQAGGFRIDHPLEPDKKYLLHSFVESSEMMNVYAGNAALDDNGEASVELPSWFEPLNKDFRYQLTCVGCFAPVFIAEEIQGGRFKIAGGRAGMKVSWQVVAARHDDYAREHPIPVELEKRPPELGSAENSCATDSPQRSVIDGQPQRATPSIPRRVGVNHCD